MISEYITVEHKDVNECDEERFDRRHGCQHLCINTVGSYKCGCHDGYAMTKDGRTCKDLGKWMNYVILPALFGTDIMEISV